MGHKLRIIADPVLKTGVFVTGANKSDYHMTGVRAGDQFSPEWHDLHAARGGDGCPECNAPLRTERVIEIGNIFKLGTKYSASALKAHFLDEEGVEKPIVMGSYGIGPARIMAAAVEQFNDKDGIIWPDAIAPFDVEMIPLNLAHEETARLADELYAQLKAEGYAVLFDDRDLRPGVKFKDADLIGIPRRVVIGERGLKDGIVEVKRRGQAEALKVAPADVLQTLRAI
jgi:prolyl-tRNA synthetase